MEENFRLMAIIIRWMVKNHKLQIQQRLQQNLKVTYIQFTTIWQIKLLVILNSYSQNKVLFLKSHIQSETSGIKLFSNWTYWQKGKNDTAGKKLIMSACKIIVSKMFGQDAVREIEGLQYSKLTHWWHVTSYWIGFM